MTNVWPGTLPQYVQVGDFQETPVDNAVRTQMEDGTQKARRRFTARRRLFDVSVQLTAAQKVTLDDFYENTLGDGVLPFDWVLPAEQTAATFVFLKDGYQIGGLGPDVFVAKLKLQTVP
jgi:hypothetical protein